MSVCKARGDGFIDHVIHPQFDYRCECGGVWHRSPREAVAEYETLSIDAPRVEGWQPIATAPKDGRLIIGWLGREDEGRTAGVVWMPMRWHEPGVGDCQPIHWMPLPTPPRETGGR